MIATLLILAMLGDSPADAEAKPRDTVQATAPDRPVETAQPVEAPALTRYSISEVHMGSEFKLVFYAESEAKAEAAARATFKRVAVLDAIMSDYQAESELNLLCKKAGSGQWVRVSKDLWRVLLYSDQLSRRSNGAFDITVGPIVRLWRTARKTKELPDAKSLEAALAKVGYQKIEFDKEKQSVRLITPGMQLDLGGIAKGYAADMALLELGCEGSPRALVNASGNLAIGDPPPGQEGWKVGVAPLNPEDPPTEFLVLANAGIATAGDGYQFVEIDGVRYSHIVDPKTGLGLTTHSSVTVVALNATIADSVDTAASLLGPVEGLKLVGNTCACDAQMTDWKNGKAEVTVTPGWKRRLTSERAIETEKQPDPAK